MMSWLYYLLEANLYLVLFYGFYRLFLQNETFYNLNRYFLLLSTVISFALPVLQLGFLKPSYHQIQGEWIYTGEVPPPPVEPPSVETLSSPFADVNWFYVFYLFIAFCFALRLSLSIYKIIKIWIKGKKHLAGDITLVEVNDQSTAFSFFNLLFIHPELANQPAVLKHEMVHIKQKHSFDVVFFEIVQIVCWFNPILHFIKKDMKLLHEYIADELTTNVDIQKHEYALFLIQNSFGLRAQPITNQIFNQSILKRRINMLNKKRTASWARLRLLLALPLTGSMLCLSTMAFTKDYGYVDLLPEKSEFVAPIQEKPKVESVKKDQIKFPPPKVSVAFYSPKKYDKTTKKHISLEKRLIIINGKEVSYKNDFFGARNADKVVTLKSAEAIKKYGDKAKYGAVEATGKNIKILNTPVDQIKFPPPIVKNDQIKFPSPEVREKDRFTPRLEVKESTGKVVNVESRYILINGAPLENKATFYGVTNTKYVIYLTKQAAVKKYGQVAKFGAVEIIGDDIKYATEAPVIPPPPVEPPPPRQDQVRFPPPIVKSSQNYFTPNLKTDKATGKIIGQDRRYIVVNGTPVEDNSTFLGVKQTETVVFLNATQAKKVYGEENGKYGAVEITGANVYFNTQDDQIKFPPPIVRPDKPRKLLKSPPPPVEPPAQKNDQIKFPPPIVKPDKPRKLLKTPPPPVEPPPGYKAKKSIGAKTLNSKLKEENAKILRLEQEMEIASSNLAKKTTTKDSKSTDSEKLGFINTQIKFVEESIGKMKEGDARLISSQKVLTFLKSKGQELQKTITY